MDNFYFVKVGVAGIRRPTGKYPAISRLGFALRYFLFVLQ